MEITQEIAQNILSKRSVVKRPQTAVCKPRVSSTILRWEDGTPYKIVNTDLMNDYHEQIASELFEAGYYQEATNKGMTINVSVEKANEIANCLRANVVIDFITSKKTGEVFLGITEIKGIQSEATSKFSFARTEEKSDDKEVKMKAVDLTEA